MVELKDSGITLASVVNQVESILNRDLSSLPENDRLELERIHQDLLMKKNQEYLAKHKLKVTQGKDGRWCTNLVFPSGERKTIRKKTREELDTEIINFYMNQIDCPTFIPVFKKWIAEKLEDGEITPQTHTRYMTHFRRFFHEDDAFCKVPLAEMTDGIMARFVRKTITKYHLNHNVFSDMKILLNGVFKYAKREGYTTYSISAFFADYPIPEKLFTPKEEVTDEEDVFNHIDTDILIPYLREKGDIYSLGLILMFQSGIRVGELVALRPSCIFDDRLVVCATEVSYDDPETGKRIFLVQDKPKTKAGKRTVYLPPQAEKTIRAMRLLNPSGEYLMMKDGKRIRGKRVNEYLKNVCLEVGIDQKTSHKIRKTYTTVLFENNTDERFIMQQLGHNDISTTKKKYQRSRADENQKKAIISHSITF